MEDGIYIQRNPGLYTQLPSAEVIGNCLYPGCDFVKTPSEIRQAGYYMIEPPATVVKEPYWSASNKGFYFESMGSTIPEDAVLITEEEYKQLLADQAAGKFITNNEAGKPVAIEGSVEAEATTIKHYIQVASADTLGHIKVGEGLSITLEGVLNPFVASANTLGSVKIGEGLNVTPDGVLSALGQPLYYYFLTGDDVRIPDPSSIVPTTTVELPHRPIALSMTSEKFPDNANLGLGNFRIESGFAFALGGRRKHSPGHPYNEKDFRLSGMVSCLCQPITQTRIVQSNSQLYTEPIVFPVQRLGETPPYRYNLGLNNYLKNIFPASLVEYQRFFVVCGDTPYPNK